MVKLVRHLLSISTSMLECGQCTVHRVLPPRNTKTELLLRAPAESRRTLFLFSQCPLPSACLSTIKDPSPAIVSVVGSYALFSTLGKGKTPPATGYDLTL